MTTLTPRIPSAPSAANTKRVATTGEVGGSPASLGGDTWGNSWGGTWGRTWLSLTPAVAATPASPAPDNTARVAFAELTTNLLLLEGDETGFLLLEGDEQSGSDNLLIEGGEAEASRITKRVTL